MTSTTAALLFVTAIASSSGDHPVNRIHEFPSMEACYKAIESSKMFIPSGDEYEGYGVMYCTPKTEKHIDSRYSKIRTVEDLNTYPTVPKTETPVIPPKIK